LVRFGMYKIVFKYEIKSFLRYIREKNSRIAGLIIGIILIILYIVFVYMIFSIPIVREVLREAKQMIMEAMPTFLLMIFLFALSGGFSIVTSVRKNQRAKINLFLNSPMSPNDVFRAFLLVNSLIVVLFMMILAYPALIGILLAAGFSVLSVFLFCMSLLLGVLTFASIGASLGIFYVRLTRKQRLALWLPIAILGGYIYGAVYSFDPNIINIFQEISAFLSHIASPLRWYSSPLHLGVGGISELLLFALSVVFSVSLMEGVSSLLRRKYMAGFIKTPEERIKIKYVSKKSLTYRLFGQEVGGLFRKELRMVSREPALVSSILFVYIVYILLLLNFAPGTLDGAPSEELQLANINLIFIFASIMSVVPPMIIIPTTLAMEKQNLALLLSSPIDPTKIVRAKALMSDILVAITITLLTPICVFMLPPHIAVVVILYVAVLSLLSTGLVSYIAVRWTDFKAENPRKALKTTGGILSSAIMIVSIITSSFISIFLVFGLVSVMHLVVIELIAILISYIIRRKLIRAAGKYLGKIEATEYL